MTAYVENRRVNTIPSKIASCSLHLLAPVSVFASGRALYNHFCLNIDLFSLPLYCMEWKRADFCRLPCNQYPVHPFTMVPVNFISAVPATGHATVSYVCDTIAACYTAPTCKLLNNNNNLPNNITLKKTLIPYL